MLITPLARRPRSSRALRRLLAAVLVTVAASTLALGASALPASAADTEAIGIAPGGSTAGDPSRSRFTYEAAPGQSVDDTVVVTNSGTVAQDVRLFATDAFTTADGDFGLLDTDTVPVDAGAWISFEGQPQVTLSLAPGETRTMPFALTVPADARPGDHIGGVVASVLKGSDQILVDRRVATRLYIRVPGELQPALTVTNMTAEYTPTFNPFDGATTVTYTISNTGNIALGATTVAGVRTWFGIPVGEPQHPAVPELLPGSSRTVTVALAGIPQLGLLNPYIGVQPVAPEGGTDQIVGVAQVLRDTFVAAVPWWILILLAAAGVTWLIVRISRRGDAERAREWLEYSREQARAEADASRRLVGADAPGADR